MTVQGTAKALRVSQRTVPQLGSRTGADTLLCVQAGADYVRSGLALSGMGGLDDRRQKSGQSDRSELRFGSLAAPKPRLCRLPALGQIARVQDHRHPGRW